MYDLIEWEKIFQKEISSRIGLVDPAHDLLHFQRVVALAKQLCKLENAKAEVVIPAAWLHDFIIIPKNDPRRSMASRFSAQAALDFLNKHQYPQKYLDEISHAIEAHSFSANIEPRTLEARIVQDADRLDALGAIGIARCFATAGLLQRPFYSDNDPFCETRVPDDARYTVDHFFVKLFQVADTLKTAAGREEGARRVAYMKNYLSMLKGEIGTQNNTLIRNAT